MEHDMKNGRVKIQGAQLNSDYHCLHELID